MSQDYNIIVRVEQNDSVGVTTPKAGGRKVKSWAKGFENKELKSDYNKVKGTLAVQILSQGAEMFVSNIGDLTGNREKEVDLQMTKKVGHYGMLMVINPAVGALAGGLDLANAGISYHIKKRNMRWEAETLRDISGNTANSGNRYRGGKL